MFTVHCKSANSLSCIEKLVEAEHNINRANLSEGNVYFRGFCCQNSCTNFYFAPGGGVRSAAISCLYIRLFAICEWKTTCQIFTKFSVHVTSGCGSVLVWLSCNTLCTSGFVDDSWVHLMAQIPRRLWQIQMFELFTVTRQVVPCEVCYCRLPRFEFAKIRTHFKCRFS